MKKIIILISALTLLIAPAKAAVDCTGNIATLSMDMSATGHITLSLTGGPSYTYLCAVNSTLNGVPAQVCRTMYSTLMAAKLANKKMLIRFYDYNACTDVPAWANSGALGWTTVLID